MVNKEIIERLATELVKVGYAIEDVIIEGYAPKYVVRSINKGKTVKPIVICHNVNSIENIDIVVSSPNTYKGSDIDKHGLTHLTEHCLFHNVEIDGKKYNGAEIDAYASLHGIYWNAYTSSEAIYCNLNYIPSIVKLNKLTDEVLECYPNLKGVVEDKTKTELSVVSKLLNGVLFNNETTPEDFNKELSIVLAEISKYSAYPEHIISEFGNSLYKKQYSSSGKRDTVSKFTLEDVNRTKEIFKKNISTIYIDTKLTLENVNYISLLVQTLGNILEKTGDPCNVDYSAFGLDDYGMRNEIFNKYDKINYLKSDVEIHTPIISVGWNIKDVFDEVGIKDPKDYIGAYHVMFYTMFVGLQSYALNNMREKYGRCYNINPVSGIKDYTIARDGSKDLLGFCFYCDSKNEGEIEGGKFTKVGLDNIIQEVTNTFNDIKISNDDLNRSKITIRDTIVDNLNKTSYMTPTFITHMFNVDNLKETLENHTLMNYNIDNSVMQEIFKVMSRNYKMFILENK